MVSNKLEFKLPTAINPPPSVISILSQDMGLKFEILLEKARKLIKSGKT